MSIHRLAAPELASIDIKEGRGFTRGSFIMRSALAAGAVYGTSAVTPFVRSAFAQGGDVEILNFALTLEFLEAAFYEQALKDVNGMSADVKKIAEELQKNEQEHVDALTAAIKGAQGTPTEAPGVDFGKAFASEKSFLKTAQVFEDLGVSAYNGAGPAIKSAEVLGAAGSIVQVEARHAGLIRLLNKQTPAPDAFDKAATTEEVLEAVKPFLAA